MKARLARKILSTSQPRRKTTLLRAAKRWRRMFRGHGLNKATWEAMA
jgi:hypothetical protein